MLFDVHRRLPVSAGECAEQKASVRGDRSHHHEPSRGLPQFSVHAAADRRLADSHGRETDLCPSSSKPIQCCKLVISILLLLGSILLTERCRTDDLLPDLPVPCLPPHRMDSKVLELNIVIDRSQPGASWTPHGSPPVRWRSQCSGDDTMMVFLLG